jgi:hypothetical protein
MRNKLVNTQRLLEAVVTASATTRGTLTWRLNAVGMKFRMAKRDNGTKRTNGDKTTTHASGATTADAMEQRVLAFAEQLGRMAGTIQAKAEGWMDRDTLNRGIASVRDGAAELLEQLTRGATHAPEKKPATAATRGRNKGRSGGVVDAPGKKHRKPKLTDPGASLVGSQAAKIRTARTMVKTNRRRGRG